MNNFKSGFITIVGRPNVGKSTLLNALTGEKIAIVSNKPQTTRNKILTILTDDDSQIIFVDTPGVHAPRTKLGEYMNKVVTDAVDGVDAVLFVTEATGKLLNNEKEILEGLFNKKFPVILIINKADTVKNKEDMLSLIADATSVGEFASIIPISALKKDGINAVLDEIKKLLPQGPMYYPDDMITDQTEREIVAEIIREKMLRLLDKEVPHGTAVEIEYMKEGDTLTKIGAVIFCEKASHKGIIIGKGGEMLKRIGSYSRSDIEKLLDKKVFLELWVKVKEDWRNSNFLLKEFGYQENEE
ncbi:MAG: GTPase Era [Clostridia bacterium]|nr:GTPase Era [Clostridia bacterium]